MEIDFLVPDVLFEKELRARYAHLIDLGLKIKGLSDEVVDCAIEFATKYRGPSRMDLFALRGTCKNKTMKYLFHQRYHTAD
jgi:hypothetical protein